MMSQLGCVTLDPDTIETLYSGGDLSPEEEAQYVNHPRVTHELLKNIPRMDRIAWMIAHQNDEMPDDAGISHRELADLRLGTQIIRAALTFDALLRRHHSRTEAAHHLARSCKSVDKEIIEALVELEPETIAQNVQTVPVAALADGMILDQDVRSEKGFLVAAKGQEVTPPLHLKLLSFEGKKAIPSEVTIRQPNATP